MGVWSPGEKFVIYTDETGGLLKFALGPGSPEEIFERAVMRNELNITAPDMDRPPEYIEPRFVALCSVEHNHDFVLRRER